MESGRGCESARHPPSWRLTNIGTTHSGAAIPNCDSATLFLLGFRTPPDICRISAGWWGRACWM